MREKLAVAPARAKQQAKMSVKWVLLGEMFNTSGIRVQSLVDSLSLKMSLSDKTTLLNALYSYLGNQMGELNKKTDSLIEEKSVSRNE